jgi:bifunctional UDP-N-acetylglucosamine pyrophosphorylase/glucosamine-1-phosphate N-acetyltransferase
MSTVGIVLAAGKGKRMLEPSLPKVLVPLAGKPLLGWVLDALLPLHLDRIVVVVGYKHEDVIAYLGASYPSVQWAYQNEQLGTGHAVLQVQPLLGECDATLLIVNGDVPLVRTETLAELLTHHRRKSATITLLSTVVPSPDGYGRIVRTSAGHFEAIVEDSELQQHQRGIAEINTGIYAAESRVLFDSLAHVRNENAQGEYYLTDAVAIAAEHGHPIEVRCHPDWRQFAGVNTRRQLEELEQMLLSLDNPTTTTAGEHA